MSSKKQTSTIDVVTREKTSSKKSSRLGVGHFFRQRFALVALTGFVLLVVSFVFSMGSQAQPLYVPPVGIEQKVDGQFHLLSFVRGEGFERQKSVEKVARLESGQTLKSFLSDEGVSDADIADALDAIAKVYPVKDIRTQQNVTLYFTPTPGMDTPERFEGLELAASTDKDVVVKRNKDNKFSATEVAYELTKHVDYKFARIDSSLYLAGQKAGVPRGILAEMINAFSYDVDFQRDVKKGDGFEIAFETFSNPKGEIVKTGNILYANMNLAGKNNRLYFYKPAGDQFADFYGEDGQSVKKSLLRTPINGARLTSGFGLRRHPILGYTKMHRGTDFAASVGTPIRAAGDGVIEMAGWNGSYGKYVRIRHNGTYKTAYAHMKAVAKGIAQGTRVRQGQTIGYVGTTGRSTGPHLHYEVLMANKQVNPIKVKMPAGKKLDGGELKTFTASVTQMNQMLADLRLQQGITSADLNDFLIEKSVATEDSLLLPGHKPQL